MCGTNSKQTLSWACGIIVTVLVLVSIGLTCTIFLFQAGYFNENNITKVRNQFWLLYIVIRLTRMSNWQSLETISTHFAKFWRSEIQYSWVLDNEKDLISGIKVLKWACFFRILHFWWPKLSMKQKWSISKV